MKKIGTILIAGLLVLAAGCQKETDNVKTEQSSELTVGEAVDFVSFDPLGADDGQGFAHYSKLVYDTLVNYENGKAVPSLAESWENEGKKWVFHLRGGVTFSDGEKFDAAAVKLNLDTLNEHKAEQISYLGGVSKIIEVEVIDELTVAFHYAEPYYAVLQDLSSGAFGMLSPKLFEGDELPYGNTGSGTAGTGPYVHSEGTAKSGTAYSFVKNENYFNDIAGPERFTVKIIPDPDSRMMALESGEVDMLFGSHQITYDMFEYLKSVEGVSTEQSENVYATRNLLLNTASEILADARVRKAIQHGIDKKQINETVLHGLEQPAEILFPRSLEYCDVEQTVYEYDKAKAEKLLDEAGWSEKNDQGIRIKDGKTLNLEVIYMSERTADEQILMAFKGQMAELGIDIKISGYETMTWFETGLQGQFDITVNDTYGFPNDPQVFVAAMLDYGMDNPAQQGLSQKPEIDKQIKQMLATADEAVISGAYKYVLTTLAEEAVNVPVTSMKELAMYREDKIAAVHFADDAAYNDISRIEMK